MTLGELKTKMLIREDLANHAIWGGVIGAVTAWLWMHYEVQTLALLPWQAGLAAAALVGLVIELIDKMTGSRFTGKDALATALGALIPAVPQMV